MLPLAATAELSPIGLAVAFAAGFVSFVSPCVWPLVPAYLSYVSGVAYDDLQENARRVTVATGAFVLGFALIFTALGASAGALGAFLIDHRRTLEIVGGCLIVVMGLAMLGVGGRVFGRELRLTRRTETVSTPGAVLAGMVFALGWSPCIGPQLGAILGLAATQDGATKGAILLLVYSLGLGVPFLLAGLFFSSTMTALGVVRRHQRAIVTGAGVVMIVMGVLLARGDLTRLTADLQRYWTPPV